MEDGEVVLGVELIDVEFNEEFEEEEEFEEKLEDEEDGQKDTWLSLLLFLPDDL